MLFIFKFDSKLYGQCQAIVLFWLILICNGNFISKNGGISIKMKWLLSKIWFFNKYNNSTVSYCLIILYITKFNFIFTKQWFSNYCDEWYSFYFINKNKTPLISDNILLFSALNKYDSMLPLSGCAFNSDLNTFQWNVQMFFFWWIPCKGWFSWFIVFEVPRMIWWLMFLFDHNIFYYIAFYFIDFQLFEMLFGFE